MSPTKNLRILITNATLSQPTGSELFVRDIAIELLNQGHTPIVYSGHLGEVAEEIRRATIPVLNDLSLLSRKPDIIHGHHNLETMTALMRFEDVPAIFFCHGLLPWAEFPPRHPRIIRYIAVSEATRDRLLYEGGIPESKISIFSNFVNLAKFKPRSSPLSLTPKRALIFSNYATEANYTALIREACNLHNIQLDVIGLGMKNATSTPETILGDYDIIFARGRAALESLAVGTAVICCDVEGLGAYVSTENLDWFRRSNFGIRALNRAITVDLLSKEISRYNVKDAEEVSKKIREISGLTPAVRQIVDFYEDSLRTWHDIEVDNKSAEREAFVTYLQWQSKTLYNQQSSKTSQNHLIESQRLSRQVTKLSHQNAATLIELQKIKSTRTWKLHQNLVALGFPYQIYTFFSKILKKLFGKK